MEKIPVSISSIMPIYNEIESLNENFDHVVGFFEQHFADYEIIVVESGSLDESWDFLVGRAEKNPKIKLMRESSRKGFGSAVRLGLGAATKELFSIQVIDLPYPLTYLVPAVELMDKVDYVISYRSKDMRPIKRKALSFCFNMAFKSIIGLKVKSVNSALKVYKTDILKGLKLTANGWTIDAETLLQLSHLPLKYEEIPVPLIDRTRGKSTIVFSTPFKMLFELVKLRLAS